MPIETFPAGRYLPERDGHRVWWCETGLPGGTPVLVLHGGPGGRTRLAPFQWFDGLNIRCIAFDQRGCGRSEPAGHLENNSLADLVDDVERLRLALGVDSWGVVGGSWGALLAVAYAAAHPSRVRGLLLRSAFLGSDAEVARFFEPWPHWLGQSGAEWLGATAPADPVALLESDVAPVPGGAISPGRVAFAWESFERAQSRRGGLQAAPHERFKPPGDVGPPVPATLPTGAAVQCHYLRHHCFVCPGQVDEWLASLGAALATRPVTLVHGQADAVCHHDVTASIAARWPHAVVRWVPGGGHDMESPEMRTALVDAARAWCTQLGR